MVPASRINPITLREFRSRTQELLQRRDDTDQWAREALELDQEFHRLISRSSGSERLAEEIGKYRNLVVAVGDAVGNKLQAHDQNMAEHIAVMDALLEQHGDEAAAAMGRHIDRGAATAAKWMSSAQKDIPPAS